MAPPITREGQRPVVDEEIAIAFEVGEAQPVGRLAKSHEARERIRRHDLVVEEILLLEHVRRVQRKSITNALRDASHRREDRRGRVRRALVRSRGVEADPRWLGLQLSV